MSYAIAIALHVVVAILGVGQVTGLAVVGAIARRSPPLSAGLWASLKRLARGASFSLLGMLVTGVWLEALAEGSHGQSWWFRIAVLLFLVCGALLGMVQRALKKGEAAGDASVLERVGALSGATCGLVGIIAVLMQLKPW